MIDSVIRQVSAMIDPSVCKYLAKLHEQDQGLLQKIRQAAVRSGFPVIHRQTAQYVKFMIDLIKPERILEAGTGTGYTSIMMCEASDRTASVDTVENDEYNIRMARGYIEKADLHGLIHVIAGDASDVFSNVSGPYDLILLDSAKSDYIRLLPDVTRLLMNNGILLSDNVLYKGMVADNAVVPRRQKTIVRNMRDYLDSICHSECWHTVILPIGDGLAVSIKKKEPNV